MADTEADRLERSQAAASMRELLAAVMAVHRHGLAIEAEGLRTRISRVGQALSRLAHRYARSGHPVGHAVAAEMRIAQRETEALLHRTAPRRRARDEGPTAETAGKVKPDTVAMLVRRGDLETHHQLAAQEIAEVFEAVTAGLGMRARDYGRPHHRGLPRQPVESIPPRIEDRYRRCYCPWATEAERRRVGQGNALDLALAVAVDGLGLGEVEAMLRMRNGTAAVVLREALEDYAGRAGIAPVRHRTRSGKRVESGEIL